MKAVVVFESMYGNTHLVADAIAEGLRTEGDVVVVPVEQADPKLLIGADLLVVGGPTHVHGMSRESTRTAAVEAAHKPESDLVLDPYAERPGLRDWFDALGVAPPFAAAFDTRFDMAAMLTGRASKGIARRLRQHGCSLIGKPTSFFVTKKNELEDGEATRARDWGASLAALTASRTYHGVDADAGRSART